MDGAREGDTLARNELLDRHRKALLRMIELRLDRRVRARVDASDVVQNVLVTADRRLGEYLDDPQVPFFLWLRQLAKDSVIDAHREHRKAMKPSVDREQSIAISPAFDESTFQLADALKDDGVTPAAAATMSEFRVHFEAALVELSETDREIILMRHYEYLSNKEVAQALDLTEHASSMRYIRALRHLGQHLRKSGHVEKE
jgi:RNA polymerase sigma-70 factor (ECF subfamily)